MPEELTLFVPRVNHVLTNLEVNLPRECTTRYYCRKVCFVNPSSEPRNQYSKRKIILNVIPHKSHA